MAPLILSQTGPAPAALANLTIRQRIEMLRILDPEAGENLACDTVYQYMIARTTVDNIAARMGYSVGWVVNIKKKVQRRIREQAEALDIKSESMDMLAQLKELTAMAIRDAAAAGPKEYQRRLGAIATARHAIQDQAKLLHLGGAFEAAPLRPKLAAPTDDDPAGALRDMARSFLSSVQQIKGVQPGAMPAPGSVIIDQDDD